jgi:anion-transporting  ArsA/GET3 family ATPase
VSQLSAIDQLLKSRKVILITGKGGIGKTLVSCVLARRAVDLGLRVLLVENSFVEQLGAVVGVQPISHEEHWIGRLGVANYTAQGTLRDFVTKHLMKSNILDLIFKNKIVHSFFTAIPGFSQLTLLGRMYYAANLAPEPRPDIIIFDGYASGHFMSLMTTPDAVIHSGLVGPVLNLTKKVRDWLAQPNVSATIYVTVPEELVMSEAVDFLPALAKKSPSPIGAIIINRCLETEGSVGRDEGSLVHAFMVERRERQEHALDRFHKIISGHESLRFVPAYKFPELGAIEEPLNHSMITKILGGHS